MVCVFFFYKGKNMEICLEKTDFHCLISFYGKSDIGDIYGYIQSYDPQLPCLLYAIDDTSSTRLLWWSNKIMIEKRNITKSRIAIVLHIMFIIFKKKKWCSGWELRHWPTMGLMFESRLHWPHDWMNCASSATILSSVKWSNNSPNIVRF